MDGSSDLKTYTDAIKISPEISTKSWDKWNCLIIIMDYATDW